MKLSTYISEGLLKKEVEKMTIKQFMKRTGKTSDKEAILWACRKGVTEIIKKFIKKGIDINYREAGEGKIGATLLMYAVAYENIESVKFLLDAGADVNLRTLEIPEGQFHKFSALDYADLWNSNDIANLLLSYGAEE